MGIIKEEEMNQEDLLLKDEDIAYTTPVRENGASGIGISVRTLRTGCFSNVSQEDIDENINLTLLAQLAKAEPLIRKDERERVMREIEGHIFYIALEWDGTPVMHLSNNGRRCAEEWQALKGE